MVVVIWNTWQVLLRNFVFQYIDNGAADKLCLSTACLGVSSSIWNKMNRSVDPCSDFYTYVCGTWMRENSVPATEGTWNTASQSLRLREETLRDILESPIETYQVDSAERKVKIHYRKCMSDNVETEGILPLMGIINDSGRWAIKGKKIGKQLVWRKSPTVK